MFSKHTILALTLSILALGCGEEASDSPAEDDTPSETGQTSEALTESGIIMVDANGGELQLTPSSIGDLIDGDPTTIQGREEVYVSLTNFLDNAEYPVAFGTVFIVDGERLFDNGTFESIPEIADCDSGREERDCLCDQIIDSGDAVPSTICLEGPRVRRDGLRTTTHAASSKVCGSTDELSTVESLAYGFGCMIKANDCSGNLYCP